MKKKGVNKQSTTSDADWANSSKTIERLKKVDIDDPFSWSGRKKSDAYIEEKAKQLEDWVTDEENNHRPYSLMNFCRYIKKLENKKLRRSTLNEWAAKNKVFKEAFEYAKEVLGSRRYDLTGEHSFDKTLFFLNQRRYDNEFEEDFKAYNEALKIAQGNNSGGSSTTNVVSTALGQVSEKNEDKR